MPAISASLVAGQVRHPNSFTDEGHDDYVFVRAIKFARVPLHAFGDEAELSIETDGRFVGGVAAFI